MTLYEKPNIFSFPMLWELIEVVQLIALIRLAINLVNLFIHTRKRPYEKAAEWLTFSHCHTTNLMLLERHQGKYFNMAAQGNSSEEIVQQTPLLKRKGSGKGGPDNDSFHFKGVRQRLSKTKKGKRNRKLKTAREVKNGLGHLLLLKKHMSKRPLN